MKTFSISEAKKQLDELVQNLSTEHQPVHIVGVKANAVLINEEDWASIEETLFLLSIPGMRESIIEGIQTPISECVKELPW